MTLRSRILQWLDPPPPVLLEAPPPSRPPSKRHEAPKIRLSAEFARRIITIKVGDENSAGTPCEFTLAVRTARAMAKDVLRICDSLGPEPEPEVEPLPALSAEPVELDSADVMVVDAEEKRDGE